MSYLGMIETEQAHTHPVVIVFCQILIDAVRRKRHRLLPASGEASVESSRNDKPRSLTAVPRRRFSSDSDDESYTEGSAAADEIEIVDDDNLSPTSFADDESPTKGVLNNINAIARIELATVSHILGETMIVCEGHIYSY